MKSFGILASVLATMTLAGQGLAEEISSEAFEERHSGPAVAEVNGKIEFGFVEVDIDSPLVNGTENGEFVQAAITVPVGEQFGFQVDGLVSNLLDNLQGIGGHFFWRDPGVGLLGVYAHHVQFSDFSTTQFGAEAELYKGQFSLELFAGQDQLDTPIGDDEFFAGEAVLAYYVNDNFRIAGGIRHDFDETTGVAGFEVMAEKGGVSPALFADGSFAGDVSSVNAGLRFYFGNTSKSLIARHRENDPGFRLGEAAINAAGCALNAAAELDRRRRPRPILAAGIKIDNGPRPNVRAFPNAPSLEECGVADDGPA